MDALALVDTFGVRVAARDAVLRPRGQEAHQQAPRGALPPGLRHGRREHHHGAAEGVEVMHTTVLGVGERAGNTPMEETVMALLTMYGVDVGLDYTKLTPLANLVQKLTGVVRALEQGRSSAAQLYQIESGIIASWYKNCGEENATELFPCARSASGSRPPRWSWARAAASIRSTCWLQQTWHRR